ncbi:MAG TPA: AMMECR1 family protein, partial [Spirochaetota bacterium]|nr:AMMECR1 family protein [Spirochaetota bacterium]
MVELNKEQQIKLLKLARNTIADALGMPAGEKPEFSDPVFEEKCGAFVTLHIRGRLRGCIGYIKGVKNIPETIIDMAKASAFQDPRFPPLGKD